MSAPLDWHILARTEAGQLRFDARTAAPDSCLQLIFEPFVWSLSRRNLENLYDYLAFLLTPEGFAQNAWDEERVVLAMAGHIMAGLLRREELHALQHLLQQGRLALLQRDLALQAHASTCD